MLKALFQNRQKQTSKLKTIAPNRLQRRLQQRDDLTVIDVRSADEYSSGHIADSRLLPLATLSQRYHEIPRDHPVIVTCRSGARSRVAMQQLLKLGFTNITELEGGVLGWQRAGLPLVH